jgi:putative membrane protein
MKRLKVSSVAIAAVAIVIGGCSKQPTEQGAARGVAVGTGGADADVRSDGEFVRHVALMNMAEIELSRTALDRATTPGIKVFAKRLIGDHSASGDQLKTIVSGHSMDWPAQLDERHRKMADQLANEQPPDFDLDYTEAVIEVHQDLAALLESRLDVQSLADWKTAAAGRTRTPALPEPGVEMRDMPLRPNRSDSELTMRINQWAADTYPVVQKHLDTARTLENATRKRSTLRP